MDKSILNIVVMILLVVLLTSCDDNTKDISRIELDIELQDNRYKELIKEYKDIRDTTHITINRQLKEFTVIDEYIAKMLDDIHNVNSSAISKLRVLIDSGTYIRNIAEKEFVFSTLNYWESNISTDASELYLLKLELDLKRIRFSILLNNISELRELYTCFSQVGIFIIPDKEIVYAGDSVEYDIGMYGLNKVLSGKIPINYTTSSELDDTIIFQNGLNIGRYTIKNISKGHHTIKGSILSFDPFRNNDELQLPIEINIDVK